MTRRQQDSTMHMMLAILLFIAITVNIVLLKFITDESAKNYLIFTLGIFMTELRKIFIYYFGDIKNGKK